jgi:hypothetical protein
VSLTGKLQPDGDVFGWYTIAAGTATCDPDTWMAAANTAAEADGKDLTGYQHYIYVFPNVSACGWAGLADMPGTVSFMNGTLSVKVIAHELGHNLGAHHASALSCTDATGSRVAFSATCTQSEYGDPFDVMGASDRQSDAFRKVSLGWLAPTSARTVATSGIYTLSTASVLASGTRSLRIPRGTGTGYWYLELRTPSGIFDDFLAVDPAVTGVSVRLAGEYGIGVRTRLIDTVPSTTTFADAPLQPGRTFTDPDSGISIGTVSVVAGVADVQVAFPGGAPPPSTVTEPAQASPPAEVAPATTPDAPVATLPAATITLRRLASAEAVLRVGLPAPRGASRCAVRIAATRWSACRIMGGRVTLSRLLGLRRGPVAVAVRIDGEIIVSARLRMPRPGAVTKLVRPLRVS